MIHLTISLTRYKESNILFHETLFGLSEQIGVNARILVLDQFYNQDTQKYTEKLSSKNIVFEYILIESRSLSYARNQAILQCNSDILLYIDSDAIPEKNWALEMRNAFFADTNIAVVGWKIIPKWHKTPLFVIKSDVIRDLYSLLDLWEDIIPCSKVVGASFGIHIWILWKEILFNENLWRSHGNLLWWEETDFCKRILTEKYSITYAWKAIVHHQILPERIQYSWIIKRLYWGGYGKRLIGWFPQTSNKSKSITSKLLLPVISIPYIFWYFVCTMKQIIQKSSILK